jgi:hypothetical protein
VKEDSSVEEDNSVEEEAPKSRESTELQPPNKKKGVKFALPADSKSHSKGDDARKAQAEQQRHGRSTQDSDHERLEGHIGQHLRALAFYFSNRLLRDVDKESDAPLGSSIDSSRLDRLSVSSPGSEDDPPRLPAFELFDNDSDTDDAKDRAEIIASSLKELRIDWGSDRRPPEPSISPGVLQRMFPDTSYRRNDDLWKPLNVESTITYAALVLITLELCQAIPETPYLSASDSVIYTHLGSFSTALEEYQERKLKAGSQSDFILASTLVNI